jgi:DNA replication protein DnaD
LAEEQRLAAEAEAARLAEEQRLAAEAEAARLAEEQRLAAEDEAARLAEEQRLAAEAEAARLAEEQRLAAEAEAARLAEEQRLAAEAKAAEALAKLNTPYELPPPRYTVTDADLTRATKLGIDAERLETAMGPGDIADILLDEVEALATEFAILPADALSLMMLYKEYRRLQASNPDYMYLEASEDCRRSVSCFEAFVEKMKSGRLDEDQLQIVQEAKAEQQRERELAESDPEWSQLRSSLQDINMGLREEVTKTNAAVARLSRRDVESSAAYSRQRELRNQLKAIFMDSAKLVSTMPVKLAAKPEYTRIAKSNLDLICKKWHDFGFVPSPGEVSQLRMYLKQDHVQALIGNDVQCVLIQAFMSKAEYTAVADAGIPVYAFLEAVIDSDTPVADLFKALKYDSEERHVPMSAAFESVTRSPATIHQLIEAADKRNTIDVAAYLRASGIPVEEFKELISGDTFENNAEDAIQGIEFERNSTPNKTPLEGFYQLYLKIRARTLRQDFGEISMLCSGDYGCIDAMLEAYKEAASSTSGLLDTTLQEQTERLQTKAYTAFKNLARAEKERENAKKKILEDAKRAETRETYRRTDVLDRKYEEIQRIILDYATEISKSNDRIATKATLDSLRDLRIQISKKCKEAFRVLARCAQWLFLYQSHADEKTVRAKKVIKLFHSLKEKFYVCEVDDAVKQKLITYAANLEPPTRKHICEILQIPETNAQVPSVAECDARLAALETFAELYDHYLAGTGQADSETLEKTAQTIQKIASAPMCGASSAWLENMQRLQTSIAPRNAEIGAVLADVLRSAKSLGP